MLVLIATGLIVFCVLFFCTTVHYFGKSRGLKRQVSDLNNQALEKDRTIASISAQHAQEIEKLKERVANQKADIQTLKERSDKKDAVQLIRFERCVELMSKQIPGFYQTWEICMDAVKRQETESANGFIRFFSPVINLLCRRRGDKCIAQTPEALSSENVDKSLPCQPIGTRRGFMFSNS